ncbi:uncharacterized protein LOC112541556 [Python bivittatus]|uniref:Uncharacterized protein LOC112541556 n=1 Tax=Python bivittatus TaxID=176946 RepID=A0A9F5J0Q6_PYTBI|nr:uncharacterized protein LOC112541556 [Python bivittatus]
MKSCLLNVLVELIILREGQAMTVERLVHESGEEAPLSCEAVGYQTHWFWIPLDPKCADISTERVEINWNPTRNEVIPLRFNQRLRYQTPQSLLLKNLIMSDSGTYICRLSNGSETHTILHVTTGCHNNLFVSFHWLNVSSLQLNCHHCYIQKVDSFRWTLNSKRLGNPPWAKKSDKGSSVLLHPIQDKVWGRWECQSLSNPAWISEICLSSPIGEKDEDVASTQPTLSASSHWSSPAVTRTTEVTQTHHDTDGVTTWIWVLLLVGLTLVTAALGVTLCFLKREFSGRYPHNNAARASGERMAQTDFTSVRNPIRKKKIGKQESLDERSVSLYYAQLQHSQGKSPPVQAPDNATVYAVIV